jgi:ABC-type Na+ efflux pump permease subunit
VTLLPLMTRELRVATRGGSLYWQRAGITLVAGLICASLLLWAPLVARGAQAQTLFAGLTQLGLFYVAFYCSARHADCLSREIREGTLGLLLLTPLKARDIVLAKLTATCLVSFYNLLAILPALAIPILLGGVAAGDFLLIVLALLNALFFSHALALLISAHHRKMQTSVSQTIAVLWLLMFACSPMVAVPRREKYSSSLPHCPCMACLS